MKILIAPDKFKGSMTAQEVCESIIKGLKKTHNSHEFIAHPLADGGDGSIDILANYLPFRLVNCSATGPLGQKRNAHYYLWENTAFIELALASGLVLLAPKEQNPMYTSTLGTGELIIDAIQKGAKDVYLFVGGSATHDGGMGIAHALGYRFLDINGTEIAPIGKNLGKVAQIKKTNVSVDFSEVNITLLSDVTNPLLGPNGAAQIYAKQKGASPQEVEILDQGLEHFLTILRKQYGVPKDLNGAAGGVSTCLVGLLHAQVQSGIKRIMKWTHFEQKLAQADWIISGEGRLDEQSLSGKVIGAVAELAQKHEKPIFLFVGSNNLKDSPLLTGNILAVLDIAQNLNDAIKNGPKYLEQLASVLDLAHFDNSGFSG